QQTEIVGLPNSAQRGELFFGNNGRNLVAATGEGIPHVQDNPAWPIGHSSRQQEKEFHHFTSISKQFLRTIRPGSTWERSGSAADCRMKFPGQAAPTSWPRSCRSPWPYLARRSGSTRRPIRPVAPDRSYFARCGNRGPRR